MCQSFRSLRRILSLMNSKNYVVRSMAPLAGVCLMQKVVWASSIGVRAGGARGAAAPPVKEISEIFRAKR